MIERPIKIVNPLGLHARAAAKLVRAATPFASTIQLRRSDNGNMADAKSILSILYLAASCGTEVVIVVDGPDEHAALDAVDGLVTSGFDEI